jgi:anti-sigma factor RsiW
VQGPEPKTNRSDGCGKYHPLYQEYLDGTLPKTESLELFLHLRDCQDCQARLAALKEVFHLLESLPAVEVPENFDEKVLSAVPYQAYKEMEPLRRERVPVYLAEEFLPATVRAVPTRLAGVALALMAAAGLATARLPEATALLVGLGVVPEVLVRLQRVARRLTLALRRSENS